MSLYAASAPARTLCRSLKKSQIMRGMSLNPTRLTKGTRRSGAWGERFAGGGTSALGSRVGADGDVDAKGGRPAAESGEYSPGGRDGGRREDVGIGSASARSSCDDDG